MYRAFDVELGTYDLSNVSREKYLARKNNTRNQLKQLIASNDTIKSEDIKELLLPTGGNFQIFISHSHADEQLAINFAEAIEQRTGIKCFIDSLYWDNIDSLVEELKDNYLYDSETIDMGGLVKTCQHANIILASALTEMLNKCECVFFLNTSNSVIASKSKINQSTYSPWIYHEIYTISKLPSKRPVRPRAIYEASNEGLMHALMYDSYKSFTYDLDLQRMSKMNISDIKNWLSNAERLNHCKHPLDVLYNLIK